MDQTFNVSQQEIIHVFHDWLKRHDIEPKFIDIIAIIKFNSIDFLIDCIKSSYIVYPHVYDFDIKGKQLFLLLQYAECNFIKYSKCFGVVNHLYLYLTNNLVLTEMFKIEA